MSCDVSGVCFCHWSLFQSACEGWDHSQGMWEDLIACPAAHDWALGAPFWSQAPALWPDACKKKQESVPWHWTCTAGRARTPLWNSTMPKISLWPDSGQEHLSLLQTGSKITMGIPNKTFAGKFPVEEEHQGLSNTSRISPAVMSSVLAFDRLPVPKERIWNHFLHHWGAANSRMLRKGTSEVKCKAA